MNSLEWIILKANGRTKKFKKYMDEGKTMDDVDAVLPRKRNIFVWTGNTRDAPNGSTLWPRINTIKAVIL